MKRIWIVTAAVALCLAACGDGEESASATPEIVIEGASDDSSGEAAAATPAAASEEEQALEFVQCMRDNGVDMPDPTVNADGSVNLVPPGGAAGQGQGAGQGQFDEDTQAAFEVCGALVEGASFLPTASDLTDIEDQLLEVAQCLRDQGLDVDDPDLSGGLAGAGGPSGIFGAGFDPNDPANQEAIEACQGLFTGFGQGGR